jgi:MYXO-CTERM domain-containing protein
VCTNNACAPKQVVNQATQNNSGCAATPGAQSGTGVASLAIATLVGFAIRRRRRRQRELAG